jgi:hypothetical protein
LTPLSSKRLRQRAGYQATGVTISDGCRLSSKRRLVSGEGANDVHANSARSP